MARKPKAAAPETDAAEAGPDVVSVLNIADRDLTLRVFDTLTDEVGERRAIPVASFTLRRGANPGVDADLFRRWRAQHAETDLVEGGLVSIIEEGTN